MTYNDIFEALLRLMVLIIGGLWIPYIKAKIGETKYSQIYDYALIGAAAAEQIYKSLPKSQEKNQRRFEYVAKYLTDRGVKLSEAELKTLIEGAVLRLNKAVKP